MIQREWKGISFPKHFFPYKVIK